MERATYARRPETLLEFLTRKETAPFCISGVTRVRCVFGRARDACFERALSFRESTRVSRCRFQPDLDDGEFQRTRARVLWLSSTLIACPKPRQHSHPLSQVAIDADSQLLRVSSARAREREREESLFAKRVLSSAYRGLSLSLSLVRRRISASFDSRDTYLKACAWSVREKPSQQNRTESFSERKVDSASL